MIRTLVAAALIASAVAACGGSGGSSETTCGSMYSAFVQQYYSDHATAPDDDATESWRIASGCRQ